MLEVFWFIGKLAKHHCICIAWERVEEELVLVEVISNQVMGTFNLTVYHGGRFGYDNGTLEYIGGERTVIEDVDMDCWSLFEAYAEVGQFGYTKEKISAFWYKDPSSEWLENDLKLFEGDRDAIEMCKIAEKRGHVDLYMVHKIEVDEDFPEVGFLDVGGPSEQVQEAEKANDEEVHNQKQLVIYQGDGVQEVERANAEAVKEGDKLNPDEQVKSNSDEDSDDEDFIPSDGEVDSADDVMFTDSEEEYDDESRFDEVRGGTNGDQVEKGKGVAGGDFSDEEVFRGLPKTVGRSRMRSSVLVGDDVSGWLVAAGAVVSDSLDWLHF
ncbi:uncharacterized protein DS421_17g588360 [Arachis hypogaea]|nr:uncharacterized protein DS421_17g588360 [Arachis hypogaea]